MAIRSPLHDRGGRDAVPIAELPVLEKGDALSGEPVSPRSADRRRVADGCGASRPCRAWGSERGANPFAAMPSLRDVDVPFGVIGGRPRVASVRSGRRQPP